MTISLTGTTDPRMFEHAVKAIKRVLDEMSGTSASSWRPTAYGLSGYWASCVALQNLMIAPFRAASLFHGPALAEYKYYERLNTQGDLTGSVKPTHIHARR